MDYIKVFLIGLIVVIVYYLLLQWSNLPEEGVVFQPAKEATKTIKKRDYKLATQRNMLKRKVKNSFMGFIEDLPSIDFVVMVGPGVQPNDKKTLCELWSSVEVK